MIVESGGLNQRQSFGVSQLMTLLNESKPVALVAWALLTSLSRINKGFPQRLCMQLNEQFRSIAQESSRKIAETFGVNLPIGQDAVLLCFDEVKCR